MNVRIKVWLEENEEVLFGYGRLQLLRTIESAGSLAAAAKQMNMSYRAAWGRVHASEDRLGFTLVERAGEGRRAMQLTQAAKELMAQYSKLDKLAQDYMSKQQGEIQKALKAARSKQK